jgi:ribonuclease E
MTKRMLIDTAHPEETRVVVVNGTRIEDFDVETSTKKQIKGNIYLAKVIRVEPSLQAAFVDYGGNRHGFLAFGEIHPDYYQIPVEDRQKLMAENRAAEAAAEAEEAEEAEEAGTSAENDGHAQSEGESAEPREEGEEEAPVRVDTLGGDGASDEVARRRQHHRNSRQYKIQEVIKRRQIMLIQVVKEERGNKGAALTTYLSLAGRYCVLMPNTARGGGISRRITDAGDRKRLKTILGELDVPDHMAAIVRTAGSERSVPEVKRDYEYLLRSWDVIREMTLKSIAPCLIHEEGNLIKRAIRDIYAREIEEILVEGDEGYRMAKEFMRMLTPSHAKKVKCYKDAAIPLFHHFQIESQLDAMHNPTVTLRSGGSIVIGQTEALVAIDVNSGRATKERHIEETALKTNIEAAEEIARQLRLRDLAGLIVIDFIDMEDSRNNHAVERKLKEALKHDRARIQVGRISPFGLLELSRQRLRPSLIETSFHTCVHCAGTGRIRSVESSAMHVLRAIEEEALRHRPGEMIVHVPSSITLYILNQKRAALTEIESRHGMRVLVLQDDTLVPPGYRLERVKGTVSSRPIDEHVRHAPVILEDPEDADIEDDEKPSEGEGGQAAGQESESESERRRRRRRRRRGGRGGEERGEELSPDGGALEAQSDEEGEEKTTGESEPRSEEGGDGETDANGLRRRRRGRRGGRRRRRDEPNGATSSEEAGTEESAEAVVAVDSAPESSESPESPAPAEPEQKPRRGRPRKVVAEVAVEAEEKPKPKRGRAKKAPVEEAPSEEMTSETPATVVVVPEPVTTPAPVVVSSEPVVTSSVADSSPPRKGWWNRG